MKVSGFKGVPLIQESCDCYCYCSCDCSCSISCWPFTDSRATTHYSDTNNYWSAPEAAYFSAEAGS